MNRLGCRYPRGLGLIELLTIVALLAIGLAFMVSMARHVRSTSANELTRKRMQAIAEALDASAKRGQFTTAPFPATLRSRREDPNRADDAKRADREVAFQGFALTSSRQIRETLLGVAAAGSGATTQPEDASLPGVVGGAVKNAVQSAVGAAVNATVGATVDNLPELNDAWGRPIALMPGQHPDIGMAPDDGPFLVSAGPDGRFLTLADNVYSYDLPVLLPRAESPKPQSAVEK